MPSSITAKLKICLLLITISLFSLSAKADIATANDWLLENSSESSVAIQGSITTSFQAESEALTTLEQLNLTPRSQLTGLRSRVVANSGTATENLSRLAVHKAVVLQSTEAELTRLSNRAAIVDGLVPGLVGLGAFDFYQSNALETSWALNALALDNQYDAEVQRLLSALLDKQRPDGSFGDEDLSINNIYITYQALAVLQSLRLRFNLDQQITEASNAIISLQQPDGSWGGIFETAIALLAVLPGSTDRSQLDSAITYLRNNQDDEGSWLNDVYITAITARAIYASENTSDTPIVDGAPTDALGRASASIVDSVTGEALAGVVARITSFEGGDRSAVEVVSSSSGGLTFNELAPQNYTVTLSLGDYVSREIEFSVSAGQLLNLGAVSLVRLTSSISGIITALDSNLPVENALVTVSGASNLTTVSDASGAYQINVQPGQVAIAISAQGFDTVSGQGSLILGGVLTFSPLLRAENTTPVDESSTLTGRVINQNTNEIIDNATITIVETGQTQQTDSQGLFEFVDLEQGEVSLLIAKESFVSRTIFALIPESTTVNINDIGLLEVSEPLPSSVSGRVVDTNTMLPLEGVTVQLAQESLVTGPDGLFNFANQDAGQYQVIVSRPTYRTTEFSLNLDQGVNLQLTDILLSNETTSLGSSVSGRVVDAETQIALEGVTVQLGQQSFTTGADGLFVFSEQDAGEYQIIVSQPSYNDFEFSISLAEQTNLQLTDIALRQDTVLRESTLSGVVIDSATQEVIPDAEIIISSLDLVATTDSQGRFLIAGITALEFEVTVSANGYLARASRVTSSEFESIVFNSQLQRPISLSDVSITSIDSDRSNYRSFEQIDLSVVLENVGERDVDTVFQLRVSDSNGNVIEQRPELLVPAGGSVEDTYRTALAGQETQFTVLWFSQGLEADDYTISVQAFSANGQNILSENSTTVTIDETNNVSGQAEFDPPLAQLAAQREIALSTSVMNRGNVDIPTGTLTAQVVLTNLSADQNTAVRDLQIQGTLEDVNGVRGMDTDSLGNTYVASRADNSIIKITPSGSREVFISDAGPIMDIDIVDDKFYLLRFPRAIDIYDANLVKTTINCSACPGGLLKFEVVEDDKIFAVTIGSVVQIFADGSFEEVVGSGLSSGYRDMVKDSNGDIYLTDVTRDAIFRFSNGKLENFLELDGAHGLAIDALDNLYVTTLLRNGAGRLVKINLQTGQIEEIAGGLNEPFDVHIENQGSSFLVSNRQSHEILRISVAGDKTVLRSATVHSPNGLAFNPANNRLVVSNASFRDIREFDTNSTTRVLTEGQSSTSIFYDNQGALNYLRGGDIFRASDQGADERIINLNTTSNHARRYNEGVLLSESAGRFQEATFLGDVSTFSETVVNFPSGNSGFVVDDEGSVYVLRRNINSNLPAAIVKIQSDGTYNIMPVGSTRVLESLTRSAVGAFYFLNTSDRRLEQFQEGSPPSVIAQLDFRPNSLVFDEAENRFIVSESGLGNLYTVSLDTGLVEPFVSVDGSLRRDAELIVGPQGNIWTVNSQGSIVRISSDGLVTEIYSELGRFSEIAIGENGIYAIGSSFRDLSLISFDGSISTEVLANQNFQSISKFLVTQGNRIFISRGISTSSRLVTADLATGEVIQTLSSIGSVSSFSSSNNNVLALTSASIIEVREGKAALVLADGNYRHIAATNIENEYILASSNRLFRFNSESRVLEEIESDFRIIAALAVSPAGEIAVADSSQNSVTVLDSTGNLVSQNVGLVSPRGIVVDSNNQIVLSNTSPNNIMQLGGDTLAAYANGQARSNVNFININEATDELFYADRSFVVTIDSDTRNINSRAFNSRFGVNISTISGNLLYDGTNANIVGTGTGLGNTALLSLDFNTNSVEVLASGVDALVDIESKDNQLFAIDRDRDALLEIFEDGSTALKFTRINSPSSLFISNDGQYHIGYGNDKLALFSESREDFDFAGILNRRPFSSLVYTGDRYYIAPGQAVQNNLLVAGFTAASEQQYSEGDVLFTATSNIDALPVDGAAIEINFGSWLPPINGDFTLQVTHSEATGNISNTLHVGGNAQGQISLATDLAFPGDRQVNGSLEVIGADFTAISQIDTGSVALAAESMANGRAIAGDSKGNIYAASRNQLIKVTPSGERSVFAEGFPIGQSLAVDDSDNIYAISARDVMKISPDGQAEVLATLTGTLSAVIVDYDNDVYVSDLFGIHQVSQSGEITLFRAINGVRALSRDQFGNTYILTSANRIFKIVPDGSISPYFTEARFEFEGVNMVNDCSDNVLFAPTFIDPFKAGGEEDIIVQVGNATREPNQIFFGPEFDSALGDIDVLYYDRINQQLLMYSDFSNGKIFSFPIICGGIDVDVNVVTRSDVDLSSSNPAPTSEIDLGGGQTRFVWNLDQVANSGRDIEFSYLFKNLQTGESRPALQEAYLEFSNTFVPDETVKVPLAVPSINVEQPVDLNVEVDRQEYLAFERVDVLNNVINRSDANFNGSIEVKIVNEQDELVIEFDSTSVADLTGLEDRLVISEWNTEQTLIGNYRIASTLFDARGNRVTSASDTFTIVDNAGDNSDASNIGLRLTTDRLSYNINDSIQLDSLVTNESLNNIERGTELELIVRDVNGVELFNRTSLIGDLTAEYSNLFVNLVELVNTPQGEYSVVGRVVNESGNVLASGATSFSVTADLAVVVSGEVQVSVDQIERGQALSCTDTLINASNVNLPAASIRQLLIRIDDEQLIQAIDSEQSLLSNQSLVLAARAVDTTNLEAGIYACSLQITLPLGVSTLATGFFEVLEVEEQIDLSLTASIGNKGRVLVLLDSHQRQNPDVPSEAEQQDYLAMLLTQAGWLHTITSSVSEFEEKLQTNSYTNYLLLAENQTLSEQGQVALSNAVSQGAGLVESGKPSQRQALVDQILGLEFGSQIATVQGVSLQDSELQVGLSVTLSSPTDTLLAELNGASVVALYVPDVVRNSQSLPAITLNDFGEGRSIYIGFDLLEEASLINDVSNDYSRLLLNSLSHITPNPVLNFAGNAIPVTLTVNNDGRATPGRLRLVLPDGVEFIGALPQVTSGSVAYDDATRTVTQIVNLEQAQSTQLTLWLSAQNSVTLTTFVDSGEAPDFIEQDTASVELVIQEAEPQDMVMDLGVAGDFNAFICDDFTSTSSDSHGRLAAGGNITIDSYGVATRLSSQPDIPTLIAGGDLSYGQGKVFVGSGIAGGSIDNVNETVVFGLEQGATIEGNAAIPIDFESEFAGLRQLSSNLARAQSTGTVEYRFGGIFITGDCSSDSQVFNLDGATVLNSNHINLSCVPQDSTIVFNIDGQTAGFKNIGLSQLHNQAPRILYNFHQAQTVQLTHVGIEGSVLAPLAHFDNPRGQVNGSIVAKSWDGPMELHDFQFVGSLESILSNLPEPEAEPEADDPDANESETDPEEASDSDSSSENDGTAPPVEEVILEGLGSSQSFNAFFYDSFTSQYSDSHGKIAAGGDVSLNGYGVASRLSSQPTSPTLVVGGDLSYAQGKIFVGSALVAGSSNNVNQSVVYGLESGALIQDDVTLPIDFEKEFTQLKLLSSILAQAQPTGSVEYKYGGFYLTGDCSSDTQIFNLSGTAVLNSNHLSLSCVPNTSTILFNIDGQTAGFKNIGLSQLRNQAPQVLYNFHDADTVQFTHVGIEGTVLAPNARFDNPRGQANGLIIGKSWNGPMELHDVPFIGSFESILNSVSSDTPLQ